MLSKISRFVVVLVAVPTLSWVIWNTGDVSKIISHEVQEEGPCVGMPGIDRCAGHRFVRPVSACEAAQIHFDQAIHYVGQSHVVTTTTINGEPSNTPDKDYYTRGYSGPTTAAERSAESAALASWKTLNCKGPINPNSEFWV